MTNLMSHIFFDLVMNIMLRARYPEPPMLFSCTYFPSKETKHVQLSAICAPNFFLSTSGSIAFERYTYDALNTLSVNNFGNAMNTSSQKFEMSDLATMKSANLNQFVVWQKYLFFHPLNCLQVHKWQGHFHHGETNNVKLTSQHNSNVVHNTYTSDLCLIRMIMHYKGRNERVEMIDRENYHIYPPYVFF